MAKILVASAKHKNANQGDSDGGEVGQPSCHSQKLSQSLLLLTQPLPLPRKKKTVRKTPELLTDVKAFVSSQM